jgi:hypothetical protein
LSKSARRIHDLKRPDFDSLPEQERTYATLIHPMTMQWGQPLADRFTPAEASMLWDRFRWVDDGMQRDREEPCPGFQGGPTRYFFNEVPKGLTVDDFIASWR